MNIEVSFNTTEDQTVGLMAAVSSDPYRKTVEMHAYETHVTLRGELTDVSTMLYVVFPAADADLIMEDAVEAKVLHLLSVKCHILDYKNMRAARMLLDVALTHDGRIAYVIGSRFNIETLINKLTHIFNEQHLALEIMRLD